MDKNDNNIKDISKKTEDILNSVSNAEGEKSDLKEDIKILSDSNEITPQKDEDDFIKRMRCLIKKITKKFNVIDFLLIGLIVISIIALIYKVTLGSGEKYQNYIFTYVCEEAPKELADAVKIGVKCADGDTGENLGEVIGIEEIQAPVSEKDTSEKKDNTKSDKNKDDDKADEEQTSKKQDIVPKKALKIYGRTSGYEAEHGIAIGDNVYLKGKKINLIIGDTVFELYISDVSKQGN